MSIGKPLNFLARKILFLWVKTEIIPTDIDQLDIKSDTPVVYVLETRSWSNLLILETECGRLGIPAPLKKIASAQLNAWHSVYTIAPRQPFKSWLQKQPKRSRMLRGIVEILRDNPEMEIQFVPVSVFWGRPVATQKHWLQVLFADSWRLAHGLRKLFTIIFQGKNVFVKYSEIISYQGRAFTTESDGESDDELIDRLQGVLSKRLIDSRAATLGPDISHRRTLVRDLILKPDVQQAIKKRSVEDSRTEYQATLQARRYLNEIVANCTSVTIQVMQRGLTTFWNKFYSGIEVSNSEDLKTLSLTHELVYVPCHRSHIDYLLLSYVIYDQGLAIPYVAAGKNLNMPVIGSILRGGGAFFIRRSFKGNELYSTLMFEYIADLVSKGVAIEYFVEGGRSRTGRLLTPKPGMLAMTIRGFLKYRSKPVAFIPVYVGYERLLESKAYQAELSGEEKKSETFLNSIRSILSIRGNFGKVYTNFGKPVFLNEVLDDQHPEWLTDQYEDASRPQWVRGVVTQVSETIMQNINQAATVNSINLIAMVLLATPNQTMDRKELERILELYKTIINAVEYSERLIVTRKTGSEQIDHAISLKMIKKREHAFGDIIYLDVKHSISLTYYRNNIIHLMALPSLIACCFINKRILLEKDVNRLILLAYPFLKKELFITWEDDDLADVIVHTLNIMSKQGLLHHNKEDNSYSRRGSGTIQFTHLNLLAKIISPILEVYYLTLALLSQSKNKTIPRNELQEKCQLMAQRVAMIHELNSPDYSDKHLIANFINTLIRIDYVNVHENDNLAYSDSFHNADRRIRLLLTKKMRSNILQMLKYMK